MATARTTESWKLTADSSARTLAMDDRRQEPWQWMADARTMAMDSGLQWQRTKVSRRQESLQALKLN